MLNLFTLQDFWECRRERNREFYFVFLLIVLGLGMGIRKFPNLFPSFIAEYFPDALWAIAVFLLFGSLAGTTPSGKILVASLTCAIVIEFSQLIHISWLDHFRQSTLGALLLGSGFIWSDILCYLIGICFIALWETLIIPRVRQW